MPPSTAARTEERTHRRCVLSVGKDGDGGACERMEEVLAGGDTPVNRSPLKPPSSKSDRALILAASASALPRTAAAAAAATTAPVLVLAQRWDDANPTAATTAADTVARLPRRQAPAPAAGTRTAGCSPPPPSPRWAATGGALGGPQPAHRNACNRPADLIAHDTVNQNSSFFGQNRVENSKLALGMRPGSTVTLTPDVGVLHTPRGP